MDKDTFKQSVGNVTLQLVKKPFGGTKAVQGAISERRSLSISPEALAELVGDLERSIELISDLYDLREPILEETSGFKKYITRTGSVPLPTKDQIVNFAKALYAHDSQHARYNIFVGYHFFIDPGAGQEDLYCPGIRCTKLSDVGNIISREEYLSRFGYIEIEPIVDGNLKVTRPKALTADRKIPEDELDDAIDNLCVEVPREILVWEDSLCRPCPEKDMNSQI